MDDNATPRAYDPHFAALAETMDRMNNMLCEIAGYQQRTAPIKSRVITLGVDPLPLDEKGYSYFGLIVPTSAAGVILRVNALGIQYTSKLVEGYNHITTVDGSTLATDAPMAALAVWTDHLFPDTPCTPTTP